MARSSLYIGYTTHFGGIFGDFGGVPPIVGGLGGVWRGVWGILDTLYGGGVGFSLENGCFRLMPRFRP